MKITVPMLDMINIAMSEVSVSSLVSNLAGIDSQSVKELDIVRTAVTILLLRICRRAMNS